MQPGPSSSKANPYSPPQGPVGKGFLLSRAASLSKAGNVNEAFKTARQAVVAGEAGAWTSLGNMHAKGLGTEENHLEAFACYRNAHRLTDARGSGLLAMSLITGSGTEPNLNEGLQLLLETAQNGDVTAMRNCSWVYTYGAKYGIPKDEDAARTWLTTAQATHAQKKALKRKVGNLPSVFPTQNASIYSHGTSADLQKEDSQHSGHAYLNSIPGVTSPTTPQTLSGSKASRSMNPPSQSPLIHNAGEPWIQQAHDHGERVDLAGHETFKSQRRQPTYGSTATVGAVELQTPSRARNFGDGQHTIQPESPLLVVPMEEPKDGRKNLPGDNYGGVPAIPSAHADSPLFERESDLTSFAKFHIQCDVRHVGIPLGFTAFTAMWRAICLTYTAANRTAFPPNEPPYFTHIVEYFMKIAWFSLWGFTFLLMSIFLSLYLSRAYLYPYFAVQEFEDPVLTNFFAAIAIVCGVLTVIVPPPIANKTIIDAVFVILLSYKTILSVGFWYTDWLFSTGTNSLRRTSPIYFMAVINFFILSTISAQVGQVELGIFLFMLGSLFWLIVFVTSFSFIAKTYKQGVDKPSPTLFCFLAPPAAAGIAWMTISKARGKNPLNDVTRFYAAILFFLLLLLARLADLFCSLSFNVGWWAYVFPLGSAATMTILLSALFNNAAMTTLSWASFIATTSLMMVVATLTVRDILRRNIPKSEASLASYSRRRRLASSRTADLPRGDGGIFDPESGEGAA